MRVILSIFFLLLGMSMYGNEQFLDDFLFIGYGQRISDNWNPENNSFNIISNDALKEINEISLKYKNNLLLDVFFVSKNVVCIIVYNEIFFYDLSFKKVTRKLPFKDNCIAVNINNEGDLYIFSNFTIYRYDFKNDKLNLLKKIIEDSVVFPSISDGSQIAFSKMNNTIYFTGSSEKSNRAIYELSLITYEINLLLEDAKMPCIDNNKLYYLGWSRSKGRKIFVYDLKDKTNKVFFKYWKHITFFKIKDEKMVFAYNKALPQSMIIFHNTVSKLENRYDLKIKDDKGIKSLLLEEYVFDSPFDFIHKENDDPDY